MSRLVYTLVCTDCHAGWQDDQTKGRCPFCREPAQLRGSYREVDLDTRQESK